MEVFVALLRAVNVGGTFRLTMDALRAHGEALGFRDLRTLGASGNLVFRASGTAPALARTLAERVGTGVIMRTAAEIARVHAANPFAAQDAARVMAVFTDEPIAERPLDAATGHADEQVRRGERVLYVFYPGGAGASRLRLQEARTGTARNMNTVAKLASMAAALAPPA